MIAWEQRSREERALLNPGFCANLLWHAACGYSDGGGGKMSFEESFLVLPLVLHRETREQLPRSTMTSLAVWLDENPLVVSRVASRTRLLVPYTKESLTFAGVHGFIRLDMGRLRPNVAWTAVVNQILRNSSEEVKTCAKRSSFVGKWFAQVGSAATVLALMGVRP